MTQTTPTPHINASPSDFAATVLMPGDPKRSERIAKDFLTDAVIVNDVRGVKGYTGNYKGMPISVMASGMGMPSMGIYAYELYHFFGVENIIRVGSAGSFDKQVKVRDLVFAQATCTDSNYADRFGLPGDFCPLADYGLLTAGVAAATNAGVRFHVGNVLTSNYFYNDRDDHTAWAKMGVLAVEMEAAALYLTAAEAKKRALAVCTVSDSVFTGEGLSAQERQSSFTEMITVALETALAFDNEYPQVKNG